VLAIGYTPAVVVLTTKWRYINVPEAGSVRVPEALKQSRITVFVVAATVSALT
jgi:hypothetical protein